MTADINTINKIKKLLAVAQAGSGATEAEAMTAAQFASGDDVRAHACMSHQLQDGEVGVGLDGIADAGVESVQCGLQFMDAQLDCAGGIGVQRCSELRRQRGEVDAVDVDAGCVQ